MLLLATQNACEGFTKCGQIAFFLFKHETITQMRIGPLGADEGENL